jgi:hypothetical protein
MIFSLDVRRARKGDCLLLHFGSRAEPRLVLVDGGPSQVYGPHLKPRLEEIRHARGLQRSEPLLVDVLMVSHVDDDHIQGILDLTRELKELMNERKPVPVKVMSLWHNSFDEIIGHDAEEVTSQMTAAFPGASVFGELPPDLMLLAEEDTYLDEEDVLDTFKVLASIGQGHRLRLDAERLNIERNFEFGSALIRAGQPTGPVEIGSGLRMTIVGPMESELEKLRRKHDQWLKELKERGLAPAEALAAYVDRSVANLSSIVALAECDGRSMLLTGDARGDKILEGLERADRLAPGGTLHIDVLKVPHHGSGRNLEEEFFQRITANHYVFSGNGEHGNPEREAFDMLFAARPDGDFTVHLTYTIEEIDRARAEDWAKGQGKEKARNEKRRQQDKPERPVRPDWSDEKHSLAAFFADKRSPSIIHETAAHLIELGEPLGH